MSDRFSLTQFCHQFLSTRSFPEGVFVDMTTGKGKDLAFLADLAKGEGSRLMAIDIQEMALEQARKYLFQKMGKRSQEISWHLGSHEYIHKWLTQWPKASKGVALAVYNLGYLPGSDKKITTCSSSTLLSLQALMPWIMPGGGISLMIYPGHDSGHQESKELDLWLAQSDALENWHFWQTRRLKADHVPYWLWMQKSA